MKYGFGQTNILNKVYNSMLQVSLFHSLFTLLFYT
jgi:hypothetical protein